VTPPSAPVALPHKIATLLYVFDDADRVLLIERAREPNLGLWSPPGGKLETATGESPWACACREAREELGLHLQPHDLHLAGIVSEHGYAASAHWLMFLFEVRPRFSHLPPPIDEGRFAFVSRNDLATLPIPDTDRSAIWPLFWKHRHAFFAAHAHCQPDGSQTWTLESPPSPEPSGAPATPAVPEPDPDPVPDPDPDPTPTVPTAEGNPVIDRTSDHFFMGEALRQAARAYHHDEVPIGAVIVHKGRIVARAHNQVECLGDATAHAEILAITQAETAIGDWRLNECTLYVTKEPCPMCAGAAVHARLGRVVFGAPDPKAGCAGGALNLLQFPAFNHRCDITGGIRETECRQLLRSFFAEQRRRPNDPLPSSEVRQDTETA